MSTSRKTELREARFRRAIRILGWYKRDLGERLRRTRRIFGGGVLAVDPHTHSSHSDGTGTVEENCAAAENAGLDFLFVTDHMSLGQKRPLKKCPRASWGQEPGAGLQHMGLLNGTRLFRPRRDGLRADYDRACRIAPFVWIPHPAGWYPDVWYSDEAVAALWTLGESFAMEVVNGANHAVRAFDAFDRKAQEIWDRLLSDGRRVTALGASDAHSPDDIGTAWTGVLGARRNGASIIRALQRGACFASEAPLLDFSCNGDAMGSIVRGKTGSSVAFSIRAADSTGLAKVRVISMGRVVKEWNPNGRPLLEAAWSAKIGRANRWFRLAVSAVDDRRAFSTPIYVRPEPRTAPPRPGRKTG